MERTSICNSTKQICGLMISEQTENLGGAGGFRVGLELAGKEDLDWVLIIDDDAMIAEDYIQKCDRVIRRYPNVVACSGTVYTDGKIQTIHRRVIANRTLYLEKNVPLSAYERKCFRYDLATFCRFDGSCRYPCKDWTSEIRIFYLV